MFKKDLKEDIGGAPTNSAGAGAIAGIGVGKDGEPGVYLKKKKEVVMGYARRKVPIFSNFVKKRS
jgi:hypothetical protein